MVRQGGHQVAVKYAIARSAFVVSSANACLGRSVVVGCVCWKRQAHGVDTRSAGAHPTATAGMRTPPLYTHLEILGDHHLVPAAAVRRRHHEATPRHHCPRASSCCWGCNRAGYCPLLLQEGAARRGGGGGGGRPCQWPQGQHCVCLECGGNRSIWMNACCKEGCIKSQVQVQAMTS